ncbi:MAG: LamG domain-containing protein, partial [Deltaproteobacteria bacterium]|nr:LamG domain-containing protein [Deltaproteobacteria bacterium]
ENRNDGGTQGNPADDTCAAYVGDLPYLTLGLSSPNDVWGSPIKYAVYSDLVTFTTPTGSNSFCTGLDNIIRYYDSQGDNNPPDTSKLYTTVQTGGDPKNKAYILVSGGNKDLDEDGSDGLFDGNNEGRDLKFDLPDRSVFHGDPASKRYDDLVRAASFSYITGAVGCSVGDTDGTGGGTTAGENTFPNGCTNGTDDDGDGYTDCDDQDCYGVAGCATGGEDVIITTSSIPPGTINSSYSATFQATGGITPYEWTLTNNGGFSGLFLHTYTGQLSGNLDQCEGTYTIEVQVSDSTLPSDGGPKTDIKQFSLQVNVNLNVSRTSGSGTSITWNDPAQRESFQANGDHLGDINWSLNTGGATGFSVVSTGSDTCEIRKDGSTSAGLYTFILTASDALCPGNTSDITLSVDVVSAGAVAPYTVSLSAEWHMDECSWNGTSGEVIDSGTDALDGTAQNGADTIDIGKICRSGSFDGTNDYLDMGDILNNVFGPASNEFTVAAWIFPKALTASQTNHRTRNCFLAKASDSINDNLEIGVNTDGSLHLYLDATGRDTYTDFAPAGSIPLNLWTFIAVTYNNGSVSVTINSNRYENTTTWSGGGSLDNAAGSPFTIGSSQHINNYFNGYIDEVMVFSSELTQTEIQDLYTMVHTCSGTCYTNPIAIYYMDETTWTIGNPDVLDSSGNNNHGSPQETAAGGVNINTNGRFYNCGEFVRANQGRIDISGLPVSTAIGDRTTVTFWMNWTGSNNNMPIGWQTYDLWMPSNRFGFNTGGGDVYGISNATAALANNWHHIAAVFTNRDPAHNLLYIDGVQQSISLLQGTQNTNRSVGANLRISSWLNSTGYTFDGLIDELRIYDRGLSGSEIVEDYNITR